MTPPIQRISFDRPIIELYKALPKTLMGYDLNQLNDQSLEAYAKVLNGLFGDRAQWWGIYADNGLGIYETDDKLVAMATVGTTPQASFLYNIGVDPAYQRQGLGSSLISHLIKTYGHKNIYLFVAKVNRPAISLYRKFGFEYIDKAYVPPAGQICMVRYSDPSPPELIEAPISTTLQRR